MGTIETIDSGQRNHARYVGDASFPVFSFAGLVRRFRRLSDRWRQRRDLLELTDDQLRDIGVTRAQARCEAARPFWE